MCRLFYFKCEIENTQASVLQRKWLSFSIRVSMKACDLSNAATKTGSDSLLSLLIFLKSACPRIRTVCHQKHGRHGSCDSHQLVEVMMSALWHAWRLTTLYVFPGSLRRMRGEYRCCLLADSSFWHRVVFITGYRQIFLITFIFILLTVSWWRAFPSLSKWISLLGSMSWVIP